MQKTGDVGNFASLAAWLFSPLSEYVTGQVYAVDGGVLKGTLLGKKLNLIWIIAYFFNFLSTGFLKKEML